MQFTIPARRAHCPSERALAVYQQDHHVRDGLRRKKCSSSARCLPYTCCVRRPDVGLSVLARRVSQALVPWEQMPCTDSSGAAKRAGTCNFVLQKCVRAAGTRSALAWRH